jgi:tRNA(fMet)-specific endonuclease VapC
LVDADRSRSSLEDLIADGDDVAIAAITFAELLVGVHLADQAHRTARLQFVYDLSDAVPIVDYDQAVASSHAELLAVVRHQGRPRAAYDLIIAATARATQGEIVSADRSAYADLPRLVVRTHRP